MKPSIRMVLRRRTGRRVRERGIVLIFTLVALLLLLVSGAALTRSMQTSQTQAGNLAFRRDMLNESERVAQTVLAAFHTGVLADPEARASNRQGSNYSAAMLPSNASGVPLALLSDAEFGRHGEPGNDIVLQDKGLRIRYVVDRQCGAAGHEQLLRPEDCLRFDSPTLGVSSHAWNRAELASVGGQSALMHPLIYRISARVDGPRGLQVFVQTTFKL